MAKQAAHLKSEIKTLRDQIDNVFAEYKGKEESMTDDVIEHLEKLDNELGEKLQDYSAAAQREEKAKNNREAMQHIFGGEGKNQPTGDGNQEPERKSASGFDQKTIQSVAEQVLHQPEFKQWFDQMTNGGSRKIADGVGVRSPVVNLESSLLESKALITGLSSTSGGALVQNDRLATIVPSLSRDDINVVDLVTRQTTQSDTVEYVRIGTETNNAAGVLEATSSITGAKPESDFVLSVVTAIVENIAHWIPITRRAASDAPQLMSYINDFLMFGLMDALNDQILNGNGTSPNLMGISNTTDVQSQAWDTNVLTTTRKARTKVRTVGRATPTAYLFTPEDWETIDLLQDAENRYYFGGPQRLGTPVLWGLPVVESEAVAATFGYVGDWRQAVIWDREQATIHMTDSHSDFFVRNILVLLAEMRVAFGILRPQAFVEIDMSSAI